MHALNRYGFWIYMQELSTRNKNGKCLLKRCFLCVTLSIHSSIKPSETNEIIESHLNMGNFSLAILFYPLVCCFPLSLLKSLKPAYS